MFLIFCCSSLSHYSLSASVSLFVEVDTRQIKAIASDLNATLVNNTVAIKNAAPDFNTIVNEDILNEYFDPSKQFVREINTDPQMILKPEQEAWIKEETDAGRPPVF